MTGTCPGCRGAVRPGNRYCTACGVRLPDPPDRSGPLELPPARIVAVHESELVEELPVRSVVIRIGRDAGNDIVIPSTRASIHHARIIYREGRFWIEDLASANGTQLDGEPIREPRPLRGGAIIKVGGSILKFLVGSD